MDHSTLLTGTGELCLSTEQVQALRTAVDELDAFMVQCVEERRRKQWVRPETKDIADYRVRELLVCITTIYVFPRLTQKRQRAVAHAYQTPPINEQIRVARTGLLTRRVRVVMRAFSATRSYAKDVPPQIVWDDSFIPPDLYPFLPLVPEVPGDEEEGMNKEKEKGSWGDRRGTTNKGKGKKRAAEETQGKGKGRALEAMQALPATVERNAPEPLTHSAAPTTAPTLHDAVQTKPKPRKKRKIVSPETVENSDEEGNAATVTIPPPAPTRRAPTTKPARTKRQPATVTMANVGSPPPCMRCVMYNKQCVHNGWKAACRTCVAARQKCSLARANPPPLPLNNNSLPVAGPSNPQPKVKIVIPRAMYAMPRKQVCQSPSPSESEQASPDSPTPADLATTSRPPRPSHLTKDPCIASATRGDSSAGPAGPSGNFFSFILLQLHIELTEY